MIVKICLVKPKKPFRKRRTECGVECTNLWNLKSRNVFKKVKVCLTDKPHECTCNNCLIEFEKKHLDEAYM